VFIYTRRERLVLWWNRHFVWLDSAAGLVVAIAGVLAVERGWGRAALHDLLESNRHEVYAALSSVFGTLLGLNLATMAIVVTFCALPPLAEFVRGPRYGEMWGIFKRANWTVAVALVASVAGLVLDRDKHPSVVLPYVMLTMLSLSLVAVSRCVWILNLCAAQISPAKPGG